MRAMTECSRPARLFGGVEGEEKLVKSEMSGWTGLWVDEL